MTKPICRDQQIDLLTLYLGLDVDQSQLPELVLVQGVGGTGKTLTLRWLLSEHPVSHAFVDCVESYQPKLLFQSILSQLSDDESEHVKCENVSDFTRMIGEVVERRAVIVLENGERLRDDLTLLSVFTRLQEMSGANVSVVIETR